MWIDSHCHLTHDRLQHLGTQAEIVDNAMDKAVNAMVTISCQIKGDFPAVLKTAQKFENVWCTVGTHPHDAGDEAEKAVTEEELVTLAKSDLNIIGIGESGLDYFYTRSTPEDQEASFRKHIRACIATDLPLVVHSRDAEEDTMRIIREEGAGTDLKGVMHCFSSKRILAEEALDFGFYISFSGIVTFKKSEELRAICKDIPLDRLLVETDAPFLAPEPNRKDINQPAFVANTGEIVADIHGITAADMAAQTTRNFYTLFTKATL